MDRKKKKRKNNEKTKEGNKNDEEKDIAIEKIKGSFEVLNISREYKGRGHSQYSNVYIDANIIEKISNK